MARASVARSPARMPRPRLELGCGRDAILLAAPRSVGAVHQPDGEAAVAFPPRCSGASEGEQLVARLDAARTVVLYAFAAKSGAGRSVGVVLVDDVDLVDAVDELAHDGVFGDAGLLRRHALNDEVTGLEVMDRKCTDVFHAAAGAGIERAVPGEGHLFRIDGNPFAQAVKLEFQTRAEQRLRIRQDRTCGVDAARERKRAKRRNDRSDGESLHSAASLPCPSLLCSVLSSFSAASAITVPGGKIASQPPFISAS